MLDGQVWIAHESFAGEHDVAMLDALETEIAERTVPRLLQSLFSIHCVLDKVEMLTADREDAERLLNMGLHVLGAAVFRAACVDHRLHELRDESATTDTSA